MLEEELLRRLEAELAALQNDISSYEREPGEGKEQEFEDQRTEREEAIPQVSISQTPSALPPPVTLPTSLPPPHMIESLPPMPEERLTR